MRDLVFGVSVTAAGLWTLLSVPWALLAHDRGVRLLRTTLGESAQDPQTWTAATAAFEAAFWQGRLLLWVSVMVVLLLIALIARPVPRAESGQ